MSIRREILKVAEHYFSIELPLDSVPMGFDRQYMPFKVVDNIEEDKLLFNLKVVDKELFNFTIEKPLLEDADLSNSKMVRVNVYKTTLGLMYNIIMPGSNSVAAKLHINRELKESLVVFDNGAINQYSKEASFTNAAILSFLSFTIDYSTLLLHSSTVVREGKAYLFLGKSGTGKSTHSRMWLETFSDTYLLNDDHPVIRYWGDGKVVAYGSPWSGKTPCYKNLEAPVGAIVRIKRAPYNKLTKLSNIQSYASLVSTTSSLQWSSEMADSKVKTLESVITSIPSYNIECLPNSCAAICCWEGLTAK